MSVFETNREAIEQLIIQVIMQEGDPPLNENLEPITTQKQCIEYLADIYGVSKNAPYKWYRKIAAEITSPAQANFERMKALKARIQSISDNCLEVISDPESNPEAIKRSKEILKGCQQHYSLQLQLLKKPF